MYTRKKRKKIISGLGSEERTHDYAPRVSLDNDLLATLINIQEKLNSPVFNGGFDSLVSSVEDIKNSQRKVEESIGEMNKAIYEPDEGLFSRIKTAEKKQENDIKDMSTRVQSLEQSKAFWQRGLWIAIPSGVGLLMKAIYDFAITHLAFK